ncbi:hypothetical protein PVK06_001707 [Gossypium arboreum]|uniref:Retrovirus-related Pol polyprotein from transposon TNT 1-94-like beta-barrel domain-containing protein n=1 Tax=Gossypium arboreum TaxID=29729 RepID=A0ABR0R1S8_GOSAR|nr:hypothetical protein PVK06_001707 [Gossypium arboreum]
MLNLAKFFKDDPPTIKECEVDDVTDFTAVEVWEHSDFLCQNYILNRLSDALYEVATIIEKLPLTWNDFKNHLKHKRKEISVQYLITRLWIEEDNRGSFSELVTCDKGDKLYMSNATTSKIKGKGTVVLKMTSGKELKLQNVMYA